MLCAPTQDRSSATTSTIKTYRELSRIKTFEERFRYLSLKGRVGRSTFGFDRYLNQKFYDSTEWKQLRSFVIARDLGCDLGVPDHEIHTNLLIHHMNPIVKSDITRGEARILDPEFLITTTHRTHNAIHYGDESLLPKPMVQRSPRDTILW